MVPVARLVDEPAEIPTPVLANPAERDKSRRNRTVDYNGAAQNFSGRTRVDYLYGSSPVIFWTDDNSSAVGDLAATTLNQNDLASVWQQHVTA